jgi:glycosyltransferase involved in cell wall biosynthesis
VVQPLFLHVFSTFNLGGPQTRAVKLIGAWGREFRHAIVSVGRGELAARHELDASLAIDFPEFPDLKASTLPSRLLAIASRLRELKPDLVLTYNWGAMEVVMANRLFGRRPLIHHEDGFGPDETRAQLPRRVWFRRLALPGATHLVVPSRTLERAARAIWRQPAQRLSYIPNGVDVAAFDVPPSPQALPGLDRRDAVLQVGTVTGLRKEKNLPRLVRIFAHAARGIEARLILVGAGLEAEAVMAEARAQSIADRVHLPGFLAAPQRYVGLFDVFALTSDTEQFPISLIEAMAARLPAVCTAVGDVPEIVAPENLPFVTDVGDEALLAAGLARLLRDSALRRRVGAANRARVERDFSLKAMCERYHSLYENVLRTR